MPDRLALPLVVERCLTCGLGTDWTYLDGDYPVEVAYRLTTPPGVVRSAVLVVMPHAPYCSERKVRR